MALIEDRTAPADIPTTNELDKFSDDLLGGPPPPANLKLGTSPYAVDSPPEIGDFYYATVKLECTGKNQRVMADGKIRHERTMACRKMWPAGEDEPADPKTDEELAAENQPELFGDDGLPNDGEPEAMGDAMGNVARPDFSHSGDE